MENVLVAATVLPMMDKVADAITVRSGMTTYSNVFVL
jgi:hypothetical protein